MTSAIAPTVAIAVSGPWRGRLLDRFGLRRVVGPSVAVALVCWSIAPFVGYGPLLVLAVVAGLFVIPTFSITRQAVIAAVPERDRRTAISLDAAAVELAFMLAPTFLVGLTSKGMTADELSGLVDSFHDHGWFREYDSHELPDPDTIYSNGFGGDAIRTINVSTSAMVIAAAAGVPCYKMGSRTYFSHSGSHNFLDLVGVKASTTPEHALSTLKKIGLAYIDGVATADGPTQGTGKGLSMMPGANKLMKAMSYPFRFPILCLNPLKPKISIRGVSTLDTEVPAQVLKSYY
jgi:hypothetical protein